nr:ChaN family lipoprotein [Segatella oulorum]
MKMTKKFRMIWLLMVVFMTVKVSAQQQPEAYRLYDNKGKSISYEQLVKNLSKADVVFIGEIHNCVITHWMEQKLLESLYNVHGAQLKMGLEMFESDNQLILNEYLQGQITGERFEDEARLWPNYSTDYAGLIGFAREHHVPVVATNVPRRYATAVKNHGLAYLDSFSTEAKSYMAPLPIHFQSNENAEQGFALMGMMGKNKNADPHRIAEAQAIKDATMAWRIAQNLPGKLIHFNGNFHSDSREGIIPYLLTYKPGVRYVVVRAVRQEDISHLDEAYQGIADYYICVPEDMTTSY